VASPSGITGTPLKVLIVGHGRMGRLIESLAPNYNAEIVGALDAHDNLGGAGLTTERWPAGSVDVIIEFSQAEPFLQNLPRLVSLNANLVIGTTGWKGREAEVRAAIDKAGVGAVVAANFSVGANVLEIVAETAARLFEPQKEYGAFIHESHHAAKIDAPSGTAISLKTAVEKGGGYTRPIDVSSTRAGFIPGIHTVGFDGPSETVTLSHSVRDRSTFAHGALAAARWVQGRRGWFTMRDVLGIGNRLG
jgi:4-hydroxy-tetrahydrodipicolinate reductase